AAVRHRCYRGSFAATLPLVLGNRRGPTGDPVIRRADRLLCILPRQRLILEDAGVPADRIVPWHNFLPDELVPAGPCQTNRDGCLYVGRLTEEKGVAGLVAEWSGDMPLTVIGEGPLRREVETLARRRNVAVLGPTPRPRVIELLRGSVALALPSLWPEAMPLTAIEALACGVPIIARADTASAEPIVDHEIGMVVPDAGAFSAAAASLAADADVSGRCRNVFETHYTEAGWLGRITELYGALARTGRVA
ncbi:MAG: glycosyltransferase, partial [Acidimicrobiales bacterium]|nr:glycosyltransferase [Acidimicrobiales bacterium]